MTSYLGLTADCDCDCQANNRAGYSRRLSSFCIYPAYPVQTRAHEDRFYVKTNISFTLMLCATIASGTDLSLETSTLGTVSPNLASSERVYKFR
eukprot:1187049-Prorocentrum_minimum.AAC.3